VGASILKLLIFAIKRRALVVARARRPALPERAAALLFKLCLLGSWWREKLNERTGWVS
jgi:hypothetical protein